METKEFNFDPLLDKLRFLPDKFERKYYYYHHIDQNTIFKQQVKPDYKKILDDVPIDEIEKYLRKKKLERLDK